MSKATLTKADLQMLVRAAEKAIEKTQRPNRTPSGEVPKVRGIPPGIESLVVAIASAFLTALLAGVAKEVSARIVQGTINTIEVLIGSPLKKNPDLKTASRKVEQALKDMHFPPEARRHIIKEMRERAEKISKKAKTAGRNAIS